MHTRYRYLFGPVPSRRFGRSLGVDLLCERRCSFDCVFCEVGDTDLLSADRADYVPTAAVIAELLDWIRRDGQADVITLAGRGEPTLHSRFGEVIDAVHANCSIPVVLLTNSSLLGDPEVRAAAARADVVKVSLSAWDDASLRQVNRPAVGVGFETLLTGLHAFRAMYRGALWLEVVLLKGYNDAPGQVRRLAGLAADLHPDKVQLNTVVRPPAVCGVAPVPVARLRQYAALFTPPAEVIAPVDDAATCGAGPAVDNEDQLLAMLSRRPCTLKDIMHATGLDETVLRPRLEALVARGEVRVASQPDGCYYSA